MKEIIYDIEANGLDIHGKIHSIGVMEINDGVRSPIVKYTSHYTHNSDGNFKSFIRYLHTLDKDSILIGHNSINFDAPFIEEYFQIKLNCRHLDTMLLSKISFTKDELISMDRGIPEIEPKNWGSFSLDAFGKRLGVHKASYDEGWERLTPEMVQYMDQDIEVTYALYEKLKSMDNFPAQNVIDLENAVASIVAEQERFGFYFDVESARALNTKMLFEKGNIERGLAKTFRPMFLPEGQPKKTNKMIKRKLYLPREDFTPRTNTRPYRRPLKRFKSGKIRLPAKTAYKWFDTPHRLTFIEKEGEFQNIKLTRFMATDNQIKVWLKRMYGFEFNTYTAKGNIRVDRDDLEDLGDYGKDLRRLMKLKKDISQLGGTDSSMIARCRPDSTITSRIDTNGTATGRFTSSGGGTGVNLAQIPSQKEFRQLFTAPEGWTFVGTDFSGAENVVLSELLYPYDNGNLDKIINEGDKDDGTDLHSLNAKACGVSRGDGKAIWFGKLYGSSATLTGYTILGRKDYTNYEQPEYDAMYKKLARRTVSVELDNVNQYYPIKKGQLVLFNEQLIKQAIFGAHIQAKLTENTVGLAQLEKDLKKRHKDIGSIETLGGRTINVDSPHKMLNYSCQGANAEAMKYYLRETHKQYAAAGLVHGEHFIQQVCIYDEVDLIVKDEHVSTVVKILEEGYATISRQLGMKTTFTGEVLTGVPEDNSWWACH